MKRCRFLCGMRFPCTHGTNTCLGAPCSVQPAPLFSDKRGSASSEGIDGGDPVGAAVRFAVTCVGFGAFVADVVYGGAAPALAKCTAPPSTPHEASPPVASSSGTLRETGPASHSGSAAAAAPSAATAQPPEGGAPAEEWPALGGTIGSTTASRSKAAPQYGRDLQSPPKARSGRRRRVHSTLVSSPVTAASAFAMPQADASSAPHQASTSSQSSITGERKLSREALRLLDARITSPPRSSGGRRDEPLDAGAGATAPEGVGSSKRGVGVWGLDKQGRAASGFASPGSPPVVVEELSRIRAALGVNVRRLDALAGVYSALFTLGRVPSPAAEMVYLARMLSCDVRDHACPRSGASTLEQLRCALGCGAAAAMFAAACFGRLLPILQSSSIEVLRALGKHRTLQLLAPRVASTARELARRQAQIADLEGDVDSREEEAEAQLGSDVSLRFKPETDSTHHFRTPKQARLFNNREQAKDGFLNLLRSFHAAQNHLDPHRAAAVREEQREASVSFLRALLPQNRPWFARFFVEQLQRLCASAGAEDDVVLRKLTGGDSKRMLSLQRRMSSNGGRGASSASAGQKQLFALTSPRARPERSSSGGGSGVGNLSGGAQSAGDVPGLGHWFVGARRFFAQFTLDVDSYSWCLRVQECLAAEIVAQTRAPYDTKREPLGRSTSDGAARYDARRSRGSSAAGEMLGAAAGDDVFKRVARLRVLARFLGFLLYSPAWGVAPDGASAGHRASAALDNGRDEEVRLRDAAGMSVLDVAEMLRFAKKHRCLVVTIPWVSDFLEEMGRDQVARRTNVFAGIVAELKGIYSQLAFARATSALECASDDLQSGGPAFPFVPSPAVGSPPRRATVSSVSDSDPLGSPPMSGGDRVATPRSERPSPSSGVPPHPPSEAPSTGRTACVDGEMLGTGNAEATTTAKFGVMLQIEHVLASLGIPLHDDGEPGAAVSVVVPGLDFSRTVCDGPIGLDEMSHVVGHRFIELCNVHVAMLVRELEEELNPHEASVSIRPTTPARKIRPVAFGVLGGPPTLQRAVSLVLDDDARASGAADAASTAARLKLADAFLQQRPHIQRLIDAVVEATSHNASVEAVSGIAEEACDAAVHTFLVSVGAQHEAVRSLVSATGATSGIVGSPAVVTVKSGPQSRPLEYVAERARDIWSSVLTKARDDAYTKILVHATTACVSQTREAVAMLAPQEDTPQVLAVLQAVAEERARRRVASSSSTQLRTSFRAHIRSRLRSMCLVDLLRHVNGTDVGGDVEGGSAGSVPVPITESREVSDERTSMCAIHRSGTSDSCFACSLAATAAAGGFQ